MGSKTDKAVFTVTGTTLLTFLIASRVGSIWILYPNVLIAIALFIYCIWQIDENDSLLLSSSVFGLAVTLTYVPMDWLFSRKAHLIFYLRPDFLANVTTPIGIILNWVVFATLAAYCYQRLVVIFQARFTNASHDSRIGFLGIGVLAAGVTSIGAALGSIIIYGLGAVHLWLWNAAQIDQIPQIASVPAFVPVSFLFTFLLCPYFFGVVGKTKAATEGRENQQAGVAGIRCGIFMGAFQFFSFLLFSTWK
jgi:hypothetical protein